MSRHKDVNWNIPPASHTWENVPIYILMDIRDELKQLNRVLSCRNFLQMPHDLAAIRRNTNRKRRKK